MAVRSSRPNGRGLSASEITISRSLLRSTMTGSLRFHATENCIDLIFQPRSPTINKLTDCTVQMINDVICVD